MEGLSPVLMDMLSGQNRARMIRWMLLTMVSAAAIVLVVLFVLDNVSRAGENDAAIEAITGYPEEHGLFGLPGASWALSFVCGLPSLLGLGVGLFGFVELLGGNPDVDWLVQNRNEIVSVHTQATHYETKHGAQLTTTRAVIVTLANGEWTELMVKTAEAERIARQLRAELVL